MTTKTLKPDLMQDLSNDQHDYYTEVWDGATVVSPLANNEHGIFGVLLGSIFVANVDWAAGDVVQGAGNVSDRQKGWEKNYRIPDLIVTLANSTAINHGTHWEGGPDLLVEIISPGEKPHLKIPFYEKIGTRELLIVHRDPWLLELFQLNAGNLTLVGTSDTASSQILTSNVLPLTYQLVQGSARPEILAIHTQTQQQWRA